jgi:hypothetical protein
VCEILPHLGFQCSVKTFNDTGFGLLVVSGKEQEAIWMKGSQKKSCKFSPGDRVRLSKAKRTFKKGYLPNWTKELFTVVKCIETRPQ